MADWDFSLDDDNKDVLQQALDSMDSSDTEAVEESLPFPLDDDDTVQETKQDTTPATEPEKEEFVLKKGANLSDTINNLRSYVSRPAEDKPEAPAAPIPDVVYPATEVKEEESTADTDNYKDMFDEATEKVLALEKEKGEIEIKLEEKTNEVGRLKQEISALREQSNENSNFESEISANREEINNLRTELAKKDAEITSLTDKLTGAKAETDEAKQLYEQARASLDNAPKKEAIDALESENERLNSDIQARDGDIKALKADLEKEREASQELRDKFNAMMQKIVEDKKNKDGSAEELAKANEKIAELEQQIAQMPVTAPASDKIYSREEFDAEAIKTFKYVQDILLSEMFRRDYASAKAQEGTIKEVFGVLVGES